jgi:hypothetical protein
MVWLVFNGNFQTLFNSNNGDHNNGSNDAKIDVQIADAELGLEGTKTKHDDDDDDDDDDWRTFDLGAELSDEKDDNDDYDYDYDSENDPSITDNKANLSQSLSDVRKAITKSLSKINMAELIHEKFAIANEYDDDMTEINKTRAKQNLNDRLKNKKKGNEESDIEIVNENESENEIRQVTSTASTTNPTIASPGAAPIPFVLSSSAKQVNYLKKRKIRHQESFERIKNKASHAQAQREMSLVSNKMSMKNRLTHRLNNKRFQMNSDYAASSDEDSDDNNFIRLSNLNFEASSSDDNNDNDTDNINDDINEDGVEVVSDQTKKKRSRNKRCVRSTIRFRKPNKNKHKNIKNIKRKKKFTMGRNRKGKSISVSSNGLNSDDSDDSDDSIALDNMPST